VTKKTIAFAAPAGLALLVWAAVAARPDGAPDPAPPLRRAAPVRPVAAVPLPEREDEIAVAPAERVRPAAPRTSPAATVSPETAAIQGRVEILEVRLRELEARRDELAASNKEMDKQIAEKMAEASAKGIADWRVKQLDAVVGLSETQKQGLLALWTQWSKEDAGRAGDPAAWVAREGEIRSRLTAEQSAKLHESASGQAQKMWSRMGATLGSVIGAPKDEQARLQQSLGDYRPAGDLLLPEAHGADWNGLMRDALGRLRPSMTPEQTARLDKMGWK